MRWSGRLTEIACLINDNETHFHICARIDREGPKKRDKLQITARIILSIPTIFVNVKENRKKYQNFLVKV